MINHLKIGFIGAGNMTQAIIKGLVESKTIAPHLIFVANRSPGKLQKVKDLWGVNTVDSNEELVEKSDVVIIAVKPQDFNAAVEPIISIFLPQQLILSLAAGITIDELEKKFPNGRIARLMPNTASTINRGVIGYLVNDFEDQALSASVEDLFSPLGYVLKVEDEAQFEALMVSSSSGTGFVFELMMYFQDWLEEHNFDPQTARKMVVETFAGASLLAARSPDLGLEDLQNKVASKKGVTAAGLQSMRELEIERMLRYSFEKAALRNRELAKQSQ
jgi:pyrroline-5-carboxylate reductase